MLFVESRFQVITYHFCTGALSCGQSGLQIERTSNRSASRDYVSYRTNVRKYVFLISVNWFLKSKCPWISMHLLSISRLSDGHDLPFPPVFSSFALSSRPLSLLVILSLSLPVPLSPTLPMATCLSIIDILTRFGSHPVAPLSSSLSYFRALTRHTHTSMHKIGCVWKTKLW